MKPSTLHTAIRLLTAAIALPMLMLLAACTSEELTEPPTPGSGMPDANGDIPVTLTLGTGELQLPSTRATTNIENDLDITKAIVLVFKTVNGTETFDYSVPSTRYTLTLGTPTGTATLKLKMQPSKEGETHRIVIMLNYGRFQSTPAPVVGEPITTTLKKYTTGVENKGWDINTRIPLCGKTDSRTVQSGVTFTDEYGNAKIQLIRSLARIDVGLNFAEENINNNTANGLSNFKLNSAILAGFPSLISIARWEEPGTPSIAYTNIYWEAAIFQLYSATSWDKTASPNAVLGCFYMGEAAAEATIGSNSTCLIVGGYYGGSSTETFYRIDLASSDGKPFAKLRNHLYRVNIKEVKGPGLATKTEAVANKGMNTNAYLNASIVNWDESSAAVAEVGNKWIAVNYTNLTVPKEGKSYSASSPLWIKQSGGCNLTVTSTASWLTTDGFVNGRFTVTENTTSAARTAQLNITSDVGLKLTVNIIQNP